MKRLFAMLLLFSVFALVRVFGQVTASGLSNAQGLGKTVYGLGVAAGWASGIGVSFRAHLPSKSSFQGVFGIIRTSDKLSMSVGGEYQYDLVRGSATRFYVAPAISYFYNGNGGNEVSGPFRVGVGAGGEFKLQEALHLSLEGMFVFFSDGRVIPLPQAAIHYYFF